MSAYKCSKSRLARFFKDSRDKWKTRAEKYQKKIRSLQIKVRDVTESRSYWKDRAKQAEEKNRTIEKEHGYFLPQGQPNTKEDDIDSTGPETKSTTPRDENAKKGELITYNSLILVPDEAALQIPYGHMYPLLVIQFAVEQIINSFSSLRGCQHALECLPNIPVPSFATIQDWVLRLGLYEIRKPLERRTDWIYFIDMTIELGKAKFLLIVGIPKANLPIVTFSSTGERCSSYTLRHHDIEVLAIEVMQNPTGEMVHQCLENLSQKIGPPLQIIGDHGSDIHKGVKLLLENHEDTIYTYDITHKMSLLLKHELKDDERFQAFMEKCAITLRKVQQTELNCIKPPAQRNKSRFHNIDTHVKWAEDVLGYQGGGDFSTLGTQFIMDAKTFRVAWKMLDAKSRTVLCRMPWTTYETKEEFVHAFITHLGDEFSERNIELICQAADEGKRRFEEYFGWVVGYQADIALYSQFIEIVKVAEKQVKGQGLNRESKILFEQSMMGKVFLPGAQHFKKNVIDYLSEECGHIPKGQTLLGTSDVLESIIGKYKQFAARSPLREIGKRILAIPLFTVDMVGELVKTAMESVRGIDVNDWAKRTFGKSPLAKRRAVLGPRNRNRSRMKKHL